MMTRQADGKSLVERLGCGLNWSEPDSHGGELEESEEGGAELGRGFPNHFFTDSWVVGNEEARMHRYALRDEQWLKIKDFCRPRRPCRRNRWRVHSGGCGPHPFEERGVRLVRTWALGAASMGHQASSWPTGTAREGPCGAPAQPFSD
jgi:hypothetical protein